jgi:hypothetical protein
MHMRAILALTLITIGCHIPKPPAPPVQPLASCKTVPGIAASCPGVALYGVSPKCMRCWRTDYYADDVNQMLLGCYSDALDIYCTDADGCDDQLCAPTPVVVPPQSPSSEEDSSMYAAIMAVVSG